MAAGSCVGVTAQCLAAAQTESVCCPVCAVQGDGFITNRQAVEQWNISTPSDMFTTAFTEWVGPTVRVERGTAQVSCPSLDTPSKHHLP
jgi:hypothetical protein